MHPADMAESRKKPEPASRSGSPPASGADDLAGYELIVAVSGGIAAYKTCEVVSRLVQRGAGVTVAMTRAARKFVTPLSFQALSGRRVLTDLWRSDDLADIQHISLTQRADLLVMAPATANLIGKMAAGLADDLVSCLVISADSPILVAPAMNNRMWASPAVQRNIERLRTDGMEIIGPDEGWLACRSMGAGRMTDTAELIQTIATRLHSTPPKSHKESTRV